MKFIGDNLIGLTAAFLILLFFVFVGLFYSTPIHYIIEPNEINGTIKPNVPPNNSIATISIRNVGADLEDVHHCRRK